MITNHPAFILKCLIFFNFTSVPARSKPGTRGVWQGRGGGSRTPPPRNVAGSNVTGGQGWEKTSFLSKKPKKPKNLGYNQKTLGYNQQKTKKPNLTKVPIFSLFGDIFGCWLFVCINKCLKIPDLVMYGSWSPCFGCF